MNKYKLYKMLKEGVKRRRKIEKRFGYWKPPLICGIFAFFHASFFISLFPNHFLITLVGALLCGGLYYIYYFKYAYYFANITK